jgi:ubiquinone biosynthesis protein COQ4
MDDHHLSLATLLEAPKKLRRAALGLSAYSTLVRDPNQLGKVFDLREQIADERVLREMAEHFRADPRGAAALRERWRIGRVDLDALARLPEGSLGRAFAEHMRRNGLDPAAIPSLAAKDELSFVDAHLYETHDVWHVVTGFGADVAGELGLQAFYAAQFPARLSLAIMSGGLLNTMLFAMSDARRRMDAIAEGWLIGREARPLFGVHWSAWWEQPLDEVRSELSITPAGRRLPITH